MLASEGRECAVGRTVEATIHTSDAGLVWSVHARSSGNGAVAMGGWGEVERTCSGVDVWFHIFLTRGVHTAAILVTGIASWAGAGNGVGLGGVAGGIGAIVGGVLAVWGALWIYECTCGGREDATGGRYGVATRVYPSRVCTV